MKKPSPGFPLMLSLLSVSLFSQSALAHHCGYHPPIRENGFRSGTQEVQYIVRFRGQSGAKAPGRLQRQSFETAAITPGTQARWLRRTGGGAEVMRISGDSRKAIELAARRLAQRADVEYVVEDRILKAIGDTNDPMRDQLWGLKDTPAGISANSAWDASKGLGAVIAILDTGITAHPDLQANRVGGYDFVSDPTRARDGNGRDPDASDPGDSLVSGCSATASSWHGTHVSGTAAAVGNNGVGVVGVAYQSRIMPVRVLGAGGGTLSDIADGITWAAGGTVPGVPNNPNPAEVINLSLGGGGACGPAEGDAINFALGQGVVVVVAAGNNIADASNFTPASCPGVITVAATTSSGARASFSNFGAAVEIAAPGEAIVSTHNDGFMSPLNHTYAPMSGTSMSAPHVSGVVALMQAKSVRTPAQVLQILQQTAKPAPACSGCGAGIVNAAGALAALDGAPDAVISASITPTSCPSNSPWFYNLNSHSTDPDHSPGQLATFWDLGDGTTSHESAIWTQLNRGAYRTVTLTVTDPDGNSDSTSLVIGKPNPCPINPK